MLRDYRFVPVTRSDFPLIATWLSHPHIGGGWGPADRELIAAGAPCVAVDPDPANLKAVSAYEKAGFAGETITHGEEATPVRVMTFHGGQAPGRTTT